MARPIPREAPVIRATFPCNCTRSLLVRRLTSVPLSRMMLGRTHTGVIVAPPGKESLHALSEVYAAPVRQHLAPTTAKAASAHLDSWRGEHRDVGFLSHLSPGRILSSMAS